LGITMYPHSTAIDVEKSPARQEIREQEDNHMFSIFDCDVHPYCAIAYTTTLFIISITAGAIISQWRHPKSAGDREGLISLCTELVGFISSKSTQRHLEVEWILNPQPDLVLAALAVWALSILALRHFYYDKTYNNYVSIAGTLISLAVDFYFSIVSGNWNSFGCHVMADVSLCMALSGIFHEAGLFEGKSGCLAEDIDWRWSLRRKMVGACNVHLDRKWGSL